MTTGILIVDAQNDFFPGGALGVSTGDEILAPINALLERHAGAPVFATRDWHPEDTAHFQARGGPWPPHCVRDTTGAALHEDLHRVAMLRRRVVPTVKLSDGSTCRSHPSKHLTAGHSF